MKTRFNKLRLKAGLCGLAVLPVAASANLVSDGDFSSPNLASLSTTYYYNPGGSTYYIAGQSGFNQGPAVSNLPWKFNFSQYNYGSGIAYVPSAWDGSAYSQVAFLQQDGAMISQTLNGVVGGTYSLSFQDGGRANVGGDTTFQVLVNNQVVDTLRTTTGQAMTDQKFNILLNSGANTLEFLVTAPTDHSDNTAFINNVNVSAVPEPTTMVAGALLLLPFGMSMLRVGRKMTFTVRKTYLE